MRQGPRTLVSEKGPQDGSGSHIWDLAMAVACIGLKESGRNSVTVKLCVVSAVSLTLWKDGRQRYRHCADVHEEEESIEKSSDKSPVACYSVLLFGVIQPAEVDPQVATDVANVAFQTPTGDFQSMSAV